MFEEKYNADRVHLRNEILTPTELLDYPVRRFNVIGLILYNEEEQERIKYEDIYRKLTGQYIFKHTT